MTLAKGCIYSYRRNTFLGFDSNRYTVGHKFPKRLADTS